MRLAALISGGKDSLYAAYLAKQAGHELACAVSLLSDNPDSYMWHVPNAHLAKLQAELMDVPIMQRHTKGEKEKELEDLKIALAELSGKSVKMKAGKAKCPACGSSFECNPTGDCWCKSEVLRIKPEGDKCLCPKCFMQRARIDGIVTGAIASKYQMSRIEKIAADLGLACVAPLWQKEPRELLDDMLRDGFEIIITAVAAGGLDESWLGRKIDEACISDLIKLNKKYGVHMCFEGGEAETFVLNCPMFDKRIEILDSVKHWDAKTRSGWLEIKRLTTI